MEHSTLKKGFNSNLEDVGTLYAESILEVILITKAKPVYYFIEIM
jgi:hypothetical protein